VPLNVSPQLAIREGNWKLLLNPDRSHLELHDLSIDPMEVDNLADKNPMVVERLSKQVLEWQQSLYYRPIAPDVQRSVKNIPAPYRWPQELKK
jgi:hypothetical protein